ncbi:transmembrane protein, putative (macronuclear) [Tetrahymena thermophila SB210]|uniref:Transmembrane protein, putative n=1 Tax=Tetrahymena thermophila (strain SB210) TaxID=312017 RepID=W7XH35_TETTS|nr:transmembrane protein, putative [Tetrahymena thermophila SB210]EWS73631.1 transmembrane protein, putative [Tetrahymena thermophila SB210]|eukprot:XP_012653861.1 transmembrane protein, putative [Tetrahymena thermophila SB210]
MLFSLIISYYVQQILIEQKNNTVQKKQTASNFQISQKSDNQLLLLLLSNQRYLNYYFNQNHQIIYLHSKQKSRTITKIQKQIRTFIFFFLQLLLIILVLSQLQIFKKINQYADFLKNLKKNLFILLIQFCFQKGKKKKKFVSVFVSEMDFPLQNNKESDSIFKNQVILMIYFSIKLSLNYSIIFNILLLFKQDILYILLLKLVTTKLINIIQK